MPRDQRQARWERRMAGKMIDAFDVLKKLRIYGNREDVQALVNLLIKTSPKKAIAPDYQI